MTLTTGQFGNRANRRQAATPGVMDTEGIERQQGPGGVGVFAPPQGPQPPPPQQPQQQQQQQQTVPDVQPVSFDPNQQIVPGFTNEQSARMAQAIRQQGPGATIGPEGAPERLQQMNFNMSPQQRRQALAFGRSRGIIDMPQQQQQPQQQQGGGTQRRVATPDIPDEAAGSFGQQLGALGGQLGGQQRPHGQPTIRLTGKGGAPFGRIRR